MKKIFVSILFFLLLTGCETAAQHSSPAPVVPDFSSEEGVFLSEIIVAGSEYAFAPKNIYVHPGSSIKVTFQNQGMSFHNFVIPGLNISTKTLASNESETLTISPEKEGSYEIICSIAGHKEAGMKGYLIVK